MSGIERKFTSNETNGIQKSPVETFVFAPVEKPQPYRTGSILLAVAQADPNHTKDPRAFNYISAKDPALLTAVFADKLVMELLKRLLALQMHTLD